MVGEWPEAVEQLCVVGENVGSRLSEVSRDIWEYVIAEVPQLRGDRTFVKTLQASVTGNVVALLHIFENGMSLDNIEGPAAASEYARRLAQNPRIQLHFTPTSGSWLNRIEIFFGIITRQAIRRGTFGSVPELVAAIRRFIDAWNERCEPFTWTKTPEEILDHAKPKKRKETSFTRH